FEKRCCFGRGRPQRRTENTGRCAGRPRNKNLSQSYERKDNGKHFRTGKRTGPGAGIQPARQVNCRQRIYGTRKCIGPFRTTRRNIPDEDCGGATQHRLENCKRLNTMKKIYLSTILFLMGCFLLSAQEFDIVLASPESGTKTHQARNSITF